MVEGSLLKGVVTGTLQLPIGKLDGAALMGTITKLSGSSHSIFVVDCYFCEIRYSSYYHAGVAGSIFRVLTMNTKAGWRTKNFWRMLKCVDSEDR